MLRLLIGWTELNPVNGYVARNKGAAGVDGRDIAETKASLHEHWQELRKQLLNETYEPYPVLRVEIPKPGGGMRKLGIPTVTDRVIQQALTQVLTPIFDPEFSEDYETPEKRGLRAI